MHLTRMRLGGVPPFTEPVEFEFDERVNVFVGPNAVGKSTVLLVLAEHFIGIEENAKRAISLQGSRSLFMLHEFPVDEFDEWVEERAEKGEQVSVVSASEDWFGTKCEYHRPAIAPVFVEVPSVREGLPGISAVESPADDENAADILGGSFSGSQVMQAFRVLGKEVHEMEDTGFHYPATRAWRKSVELADACSKVICGEIIRDSQTHPYTPGPDVRGYFDYPHPDLSRIKILPAMGINTNDVRNFDNYSVWEAPSYSTYREDAESIPIYLGHLSSGTEGTLLWIRWLAFKMVHHYGFEEGWEKQPAILLIDEIENHLHPTWQRRVIPALLEHFPGLQIFATTHSPFVVAGREIGQVHQLIRDTNGLITVKTNTEPIKGLTADEISRKYLEVQDPTDLATAEAAAELRQLRDEGPRDAEDAEAARQARMQELRRLVDRDLLAGGPMARRREDFAKRFQEALERRRQEELNQENG